MQTQAKSQMGFLSPVVNLTGLQGNSKVKHFFATLTIKMLLGIVL